MISSHSITLRNCRTLPGQLQDCSVASASSPKARGAMRAAAAARSIRWPANKGMSSRRSISGGTAIGTTARR